jgi:hypothetical protein
LKQKTQEREAGRKMEREREKEKEREREKERGKGKEFLEPLHPNAEGEAL